jgi:hypothetical protein
LFCFYLPYPHNIIHQLRYTNDSFFAAAAATVPFCRSISRALSIFIDGGVCNFNGTSRGQNEKNFFLMCVKNAPSVVDEHFVSFLQNLGGNISQQLLIFYIFHIITLHSTFSFSSWRALFYSLIYEKH